MQKKGQTDTEVLVIGGGASGLMAAGRAAEEGARVVLLEKTDAPGKKILVSGKMRCNLTNAADLPLFMAMYGPNGRFLHGAFSRFFRPELLAFFERYGLSTKTERGGRIFPVSDAAGDVVRVFERYLADHRVRTVLSAPVRSVAPAGPDRLEVRTANDRYFAASVILAAGGASWPATGSTGDGYTLAAALGHAIVKPRPALVPLIVREAALVRSLQDVSLRNVRASVFRGEAAAVDASAIPARDYGRGENKTPRPPLIESRFGEMLFTHFGLGGPIILLMSLAAVDALEEGPVSVLIDLKPALTKDRLRRRLQEDLHRFGKRRITLILKDYLPGKVIEPLLGLAGLNASLPAHQVDAGGRDRIVDTLKALRFNIRAPLPLSRAIVTAGGVALAEVDPRTMASRKIPGLYFCGEVLDIDADTGGYNLQAAFSTGYVAGECAAAFVRGRKCA